MKGFGSTGRGPPMQTLNQNTMKGAVAVKNGMAISAICRQLKLVCDRIDNMSMDIEQFEQNNSTMVEVYASHRLDELEHAQMLTLKLTELITQADAEDPVVNTDEGGSVFAEGELDDNTGKVVEVEYDACGDDK